VNLEPQFVALLLEIIYEVVEFAHVPLLLSLFGNRS
jgi:hypothetical protein